MAMAVYAAHTGRQTWLVRYLVATAVLGTAFLVIKAFEYTGDYNDGLMPGLSFDDAEWREQGLHPARVRLFLYFYYLMTGLHAVHLIIGIVLLGVIAWRAWGGRFNPHYYSPVEVSGLYWHFVDVVWIFLLPLLYLVDVRGG